jgi:hypothetical protein
MPVSRTSILEMQKRLDRRLRKQISGTFLELRWRFPTSNRSTARAWPIATEGHFLIKKGVIQAKNEGRPFLPSKIFH